jgi:predicted TIM-barrel fold metal-dependent hydrolase
VRDGYRIIDTDTHVWPSMEVLKKYADNELLSKWDESLGKYERKVERPLTYGDPEGPWTNLSIQPRAYQRGIGEKSELEEELGAGGRGALEGKIRHLEITERSPRVGVGHDNSEGRLLDMDREGIDVHLLIPGTWPLSATVLPVDVAVGLYEAYARYMWDFCAPDPARLKSTLILSARDPEWSAKQVKNNAGQQSLSSAMVTLPQGVPIDDPDLEPIWAAMADADLPLLHHSFFYEPPYFPGYRDVWDNIVVARTAAHPWGAQLIVAYLLLSGVFDRYPNLRIGFSETGVGWLPQWLRRLDMQSRHLVGSGPALKKKPSEYAAAGNVYCGIELYEGEEVAHFVNEVLGDGVLMYQSDYPHAQCQFPDSPAGPLSWSGLTEDQRVGMFSGNAERYLRM